MKINRMGLNKSNHDIWRYHNKQYEKNKPVLNKKVLGKNAIKRIVNQCISELNQSFITEVSIDRFTTDLFTLPIPEFSLIDLSYLSYTSHIAIEMKFGCEYVGCSEGKKFRIRCSYDGVIPEFSNRVELAYSGSDVYEGWQFNGVQFDGVQFGSNYYIASSVYLNEGVYTNNSSKIHLIRLRESLKEYLSIYEVENAFILFVKTLFLSEFQKRRESFINEASDEERFMFNEEQTLVLLEALK